MDIYVLDSLLRRIALIDMYESLIWTDRFASIGDFELVLKNDPTNKLLLPKGARLALNGSDRMMVVETIVIKDDANGQSLMTVTGLSFEAILKNRVARHTFDDMESSPRWNLEGTPSYLARAIFKYICIDGTLDSKDIIPYMQNGTLSPPTTIPEPTEILRIGLEPSTLYDAILLLCKDHNLGFRIVRGPDNTKLYFEVYTGNDRTSNQSTYAPLIFSPELDTLANVSQMSTIAEHKNVAYVLSPSGTTIVYANNDGTDRIGFDRRILLVEVDNVRQNPNENWMTTIQILQRRGREALVNHRQMTAFDGEIPKFGYKYGVDYLLGDLVEMRKSSESVEFLQVTEQIFISDAEGDRSYPTLAIYEK